MDTIASLKAELAQAKADAELDMQVQAWEDQEQALGAWLDHNRFLLAVDPEESSDPLVWRLERIRRQLSFSPLPVAAPKRGLFSRIFNRKA